jgi:hypothetical protein
LFNGNGDDAAFERAAEMGRQDAGVYIFDDEKTVNKANELTWIELLEQPMRLSLAKEASFLTLPSFSKAANKVESAFSTSSNSPTDQDMDSLEFPKYEGSADAYTVPIHPMTTSISTCLLYTEAFRKTTSLEVTLK